MLLIILPQNVPIRESQFWIQISWKVTCTLSLEFYFSTYFFSLWQYILVTGSIFFIYGNFTTWPSGVGILPPGLDQLNPSNPSTTALTPQSSKTRYLVIHHLKITFGLAIINLQLFCLLQLSKHRVNKVSGCKQTYNPVPLKLLSKYMFSSGLRPLRYFCEQGYFY